MKITKIKEDITTEIANTFKKSIAIDTEATGLQIPERDKLSLIQICDENENVFIIQPNKTNYKAPNLVSVLENEKIQYINYPSISFPEKIKSLNLLKVNHIEGILIAIKGQYLLFDNNTVINIRKHTGFKIQLTL